MPPFPKSRRISVSANGIKTTAMKINGICDWPRPRDNHEVQSFLGLCSYYRSFVNGLANIAAPLHRLMYLKSQFNWTAECEAAFKRLKNASNPIVSYAQSSGMFILDTDASNNVTRKKKSSSTSATLLSKPEKNYCATRKELLAIVRAVEHCHKYLYGREFLIRTDHAALI